MRSLEYLWRITLLLLLATTLVSTSAASPLQAENGTLGTTVPTDTGGPVEATVNGTFRPSGRDSSDWYFTIEGANNGTYARWGVAEFDTSGLFSGAILDLTGFELTLTQSNAYFTKDCAVAFFITEDTTTNIGPGSGLVWDSGDTLYGVGAQLDPKTAAGTGTFTEVADSHEDTYDLAPDLSAAIKTYLITQINSGDPVRVIVAPNDGDVAATWAGYSNFTYDGPKLTVVATVESAAALVINEVDYDQAGTDAAEFIEIRNNGHSSANLGAYQLVLVNGTGRWHPACAPSLAPLIRLRAATSTEELIALTPSDRRSGTRDLFRLRLDHHDTVSQRARWGTKARRGPWLCERGMRGSDMA